MTPFSISGLQYVLGEQQRPYREASGFDTLGMPQRPAMWGWGNYFETNRDVTEMLVAVGRNVIEAADVGRTAIDGVIVARANVLGPDETAVPAIAAILGSLGIPGAIGSIHTGNGCSTALGAIRAAGALVAGGAMRNVLVLSGDKAGAGERRAQRFGIFSDAACGCVVSESGRGEFQIIAVSQAIDTATMHAEAGFSSGLAQQTNRQLLGSSSAASIQKVFSNNVFLPIVMLKEQEAGFEAAQIHTENISRIGHCYASDPLINFADFAAGGHVRPEHTYMLAADSPGLRISMLVEKT